MYKTSFSAFFCGLLFVVFLRGISLVATENPTTVSVDSDLVYTATSRGCRNQFEGFGVHLGALSHVNKTTDAVIAQVIHFLYNDLNLRLYRTSYEKEFSPSPFLYDISCGDANTCAWNRFHKALSKYSDAKIFASIWSPPLYMKNAFHNLQSKHEDNYYHYIKNISALIQEKFNQSIELVSLVNEPENSLAPWDHTNMLPHQLCSMVEKFNDSMIRACPENGWYSTTKLFMRHKLLDVDCERACKIVLTHAYALNFNPLSPHFLLAYYDLTKYPPRSDGKPVWQTEVSSTYWNSENSQMLEAIDFAISIIQFVGTTCVSRYYFWSAFTMYPSGESLIWGSNSTNELKFPKKYFSYKHFTKAAAQNPNSKVWRCDEIYFNGLCLQFGYGNSPTVFVNKNKVSPKKLKIGCLDLCCTTHNEDYACGFEDTVPPHAVCSCHDMKRR